MAYFSHDLGARNSAALLKVRMKMGAEGYGLYFMILERLAEAKDHVEAKDYDAMAYELHADVEKVRSVVEDFGLFEMAEVNGQPCFYSASLMKRLQTDSPRVAAAKKAAQARWGSNAGEGQQSASCENTNAQNASCAAQNASERIENASCEEETHDAYLKENKRKENKINPPQSATHTCTREAGADGPLAEEEEGEIDKIFNRQEEAYAVNVQQMIRGVAAASDLMKIRRYLTDRERRQDVICLMGAWDGRPVHELIQCLNSMEQKEQIAPIAWEEWKALEAYRVMSVSDRRKVRNMLRERPDRWDDFVSAAKEVDGNQKIKAPSRFIISRISA